MTRAAAPTTPYLSVVVPVYNEHENIEPLLARIDAALADFTRPWELIIVDDGSRDRTAEVLAQAARSHPRLTVLSLRRNYGQTTAMQAGFDHAHGEIIVSMDGDLQNDPADILKLVHAMETTQADIVSGWRKARKDHAIKSNLPSRIANRLITALTGLTLHDLGCSLKAYRRDLLDELHIYGELHRFIPAVAMQYGAKIVEVEVQHHARQFGHSKYGLDKTIRVALDIIQLVFFQKFIQRPLHFFGYAGLCLLLPGCLMLGWLLVLKLFGFDIGGRPMLLGGMMFVLLGMQLLGMGVLGELLTRIYHEPQGRKQYLLKPTRPATR